MKRAHLRKSLIGGALVLALAGAALGARTPDREGPPPASTVAPKPLTVFSLAALLSQAPPDTLVVYLDEPKTPMTGALPVSAFGADDAAFIKAAPKARRIVLVGGDAVRVDRVARQLIATGRKVDVLEGGVEAWNKAMDEDPTAPAATAPREEWSAYEKNVALRRYFGDKAAAPPPAVKAPAPVLAAPPTAKKREGC